MQAAQKSNGVRWTYDLLRVCWPFVFNSCELETGYQRRKSAEQPALPSRPSVTAEKGVSLVVAAVQSRVAQA